MSETPEPVVSLVGSVGTISHRRLLLDMIAITAVLSAVALFADSGRSFLGIWVGGILSGINFLWLDRSLRGVFQYVAEGGKPGLLAIRYFFRYILIGLVLVAIFWTGVLPIAPVILGLGTFAMAVVFEGIRLIFRNP